MYSRNIGKSERSLRVIIAMILFIVGYFYADKYYMFAAYFFGTIFLITGIVGWCPLFTIFKYSSKGKGIDKITKRDIEKAVKEGSISTNLNSGVQKSKVKATPKKKVENKKVVLNSSKTTTKKTPVKKVDAKTTSKKSTSTKKKSTSKTKK